MSSLAFQHGFSRPRTVRPALCVASPAPRVRAVAPLRLTRRGRIVVVLLLVALLLGAFTVFGSGSAATGERGVPVETRTVVAGEGDTLWGIASEVADPGETREMVHRIRQLNALTGAGLTVGQEVAVPVG